MGKIDKLMDFIWLLNAQVNSLHEPKLLTQNAVKKAKEFEDRLKEINLSGEEADIIKKELENSLIYMKETSKKLAELEEEIFAILENLTQIIKTTMQ
ncbi:hypothetical protein D2962_04565 [Biomaibacter acetigenes]|jgi:hypothetical protein|uniref:Uncharacterized protein n=1 Tax=Biomaibacter acetigenes TaxID=2316383 RepID=A0A3G2R3K1_9FIRM|nr:hypothetical protein [Biomaibacter acetigenes]AYO29972.1 hypothetical protein D2962_04565 [Biomaibacter acetigenes]